MQTRNDLERDIYVTRRAQWVTLSTGLFLVILSCGIDLAYAPVKKLPLWSYLAYCTFLLAMTVQLAETNLGRGVIPVKYPDKAIRFRMNLEVAVITLMAVTAFVIKWSMPPTPPLLSLPFEDMVILASSTILAYSGVGMYMFAFVCHRWERSTQMILLDLE